MPETEPSGTDRLILLLVHPARQDAVDTAHHFADLLSEAGLTVAVLPDQQKLRRKQMTVLEEAGKPELVVVLGGDGTILWGADVARAYHCPLLGLNLGHVGFLAEAEQDELSEVAHAVVQRDYRVENRMTLDVCVTRGGENIYRSWALNEVSVEKAQTSRMIDVFLAVDAQPVSRWGADGILVSTPTGSTAYAWSAGGPVVWPEVEAILVVPNSAHALFTRPMVINPNAEITIDLVPGRDDTAQMWSDGRRHVYLEAGDRITVCRSPEPTCLARLHSPAFAERLVRKFHLPVQGWREAREA